MLVFGTCNPCGLDAKDYNGCYLTTDDIKRMCHNNEIVGKPVKLEHRGNPIGSVISAWSYEGRLDCVLEVDENTIEGMFGQEFVKRGLCRELSLGYNLCMSRGLDGKLQAGNKSIVEVSLVKQGAREGCQVHAWEAHHM